MGVGFEYGFAPNWSAGIEYDHLYPISGEAPGGRPLTPMVEKLQIRSNTELAATAERLTAWPKATETKRRGGKSRRAAARSAVARQY